MRRKLIAANWKMHPPPKEWDVPDSPYRPQAGADIVVFPSFLDMHRAVEEKLTIGGQCGRPEPQGAFTGDVSMKMLKDMGCTYVLCGHSERRREHGETDTFIAEQVVAALEVGLHPILCIGETKQERDNRKIHDVLRKQLAAFRFPLSAFTVAYEPVWAIGTGVNALPDDVQAMHAFIRSLLQKETRAATRILYGGSVTDLNAADFLARLDIDGLLVGGASLDPQKFAAIVEAALAVTGSPSP